MSTVSSTNTTQHTAAPPKGRTTAQNIGLILAFIVLGVILLLPTPETLSLVAIAYWCPRLCYHLMDDIGCILSGQCDHDHSPHSLIARILTES